MPRPRWGHVRMNAQLLTRLEGVGWVGSLQVTRVVRFIHAKPGTRRNASTAKACGLDVWFRRTTEARTEGASVLSPSSSRQLVQPNDD